MHISSIKSMMRTNGSIKMHFHCRVCVTVKCWEQMFRLLYSRSFFLRCCCCIFYAMKSMRVRLFTVHMRYQKQASISTKRLCVIFAHFMFWLHFFIHWSLSSHISHSLKFSHLLNGVASD